MAAPYPHISDGILAIVIGSAMVAGTVFLLRLPPEKRPKTPLYNTNPTAENIVFWCVGVGGVFATLVGVLHLGYGLLQKLN